MRRNLPLFVALTAAVAGCGGGDAPAPAPRAGLSRPALRSVLLPGIPHVLQRPDFCGEAVVEMFAKSRGSAVTQDDVFALSGMPPERGMGATTRELRVALERLGVQPGRVWSEARTPTLRADLERLFEELHEDLARGVPSIVCQHWDDRPGSSEHFRLVVGYDAEKDLVRYHDPAVEGGGYLSMPRERFLRLWPLAYEAERATVIRLRLDARELPRAVPRAGTHGPAAFAQRVLALKPTLPRNASVRVEPPFVVVGDGGEERLEKHATGTVRWAVQKLKQDFFERDPERVLTVWLMERPETYLATALRLTGEDPGTPYGFYSSRADALVMNIGTGGGTLVHEIVHPFVEANVPGCPAWINEGLGSLFEASAERGGHIVGVVNWRLAGLQRAIQAGRAPALGALVGSSAEQFYADSGRTYAAARYLLYHLQEHGKLQRFWRDWLRARGADPTGRATLEAVLGEKLAAFQPRWEAWVLKLR